MVWLDEAMTGVDATVKASLMGLTIDFELDVMLTAHDEWCTYPTVPAVAVYDLARQAHRPRLVEGIDGRPLVNVRQLRADQRASARAAAERERAAVTELLVGAGVRPPAVAAWLTDQGLPAAGSGDLRALAEQVVQAWQQLPGADDTMPLAQLAATVANNDAHVLDYDQPLGRSVARLVAAEYALPRPLRAGRDWRRAWAQVGVKCDGVSSRVLVLNLPLTGEAPAAAQRSTRTTIGGQASPVDRPCPGSVAST